MLGSDRRGVYASSRMAQRKKVTPKKPAKAAPKAASRPAPKSSSAGKKPAKASTGTRSSGSAKAGKPRATKAAPKKASPKAASKATSGSTSKAATKPASKKTPQRAKPSAAPRLEKPKKRAPKPKAPALANPPAASAPSAPPARISSYDFAIELARLAHDDKCTDIVVLDVRGLSPISDFVVVASGTSDRQMRAVADHAEDEGARHGHHAFRSSKDPRALWLLIDFSDVVIHIFEPNTRAHYDIEMMWGDAKRVPWERKDTKAPSKPRSRSVQS